VNRVLRAATLGVLLLSPIALSACSAGQITQTATQQRDKTGGQAHIGDLSVREVALVPPSSGTYAPGDDAELQLAIANDGSQDDTLTDISGTGFTKAVFTDAAGVADQRLRTESGPTSAAAGSGSAAAGSGSAAPASASASPATSAVPTEIPIPAGSTVFVGPNGSAHITLTGLDNSLTTGQYVTLKLTFANAGVVTVLATVATPSQVQDRSDSYDFNQSASPSSAG
jgi:hypothetical protein